MANTQTTVPLFVANTVLTAAQQNLSAGTGVPVFATTVTRDAAFGGSNKALAEGQLAYIEASNVVQYYDGAAWATVGPATAGALTLISRTVIPAATTTQNIDSLFSSTYKNYLILYDNFVASTAADLRLQFRYGSTTQATSYFGGVQGWDYAGSVTTKFNSSTVSGFVQSMPTGSAYSVTQMLVSGVGNSSQTPVTVQNGMSNQNNYSYMNGQLFNITAQTYTGIALTATAGTFQGNVSVYGYAQS